MYSSVEDLRREFESRCESLRFLDCNVWVGEQTAPGFAHAGTVPELRQLLESSHIAESVATHVAAVSYDFAQGNELTLQAIAGYDQMYGAVVLVPAGTGEMGPVADYVDHVLSRKARLARMFPKKHSFSLQPWCVGAVMDVLRERSMPLIIWHSETSWEEIHELCAAYRELPVIIEGTGRKMLYDDRMFYQLLPIHPNLHLEMHNLSNCLLIEDIVSRFGPERLVFGSYLPYQEPGVTMMPITHASVSDDARRLMAGDNLRRLIAEVRL